MELIRKRERASNFNNSEVHLLMELVTKYRSIIENKKTDAVTNKDKDAAWVKIASVFNAASNSTSERSAKTLKLKYESLKKITKKKTAQQRQELYKTGGGPSTTPNLNTIEEKVLAVCSNISGLDARNDSDSIIEKTESVQVEVQEKGIESHDVVETNELNESLNILNTAEQIIKKSVDANELNDGMVEDDDKWRSWNPKALKSKPSKILRPQALKASVTAQLDALTNARLQLVKLQTDIAQREHDFIKEEHELKIMHLHNEERRKQDIHEVMMSNLRKND